jgi:hypothetical protein
MVKIRINFAYPADDTIMVPDDTSSLSTHVNMHPPSRLYDAMLPRSTVVDVVRTTPLHLRASSNTMHQGENDAARR